MVSAFNFSRGLKGLRTVTILNKQYGSLSPTLE
jgi:hypothetical protein